MNSLPAFLLLILICVVAFAVSKAVQNATGRTHRLGAIGLLTFVIGFVVTSALVVFEFHLTSPVLWLSIGAIAACWSIVAQAIGGQKNMQASRTN